MLHENLVKESRLFGRVCFQTADIMGTFCAELIEQGPQ